MGKTKQKGKEMKRILVLSMIIFGFSSAFSQDLIKTIQQLTIENDSLKKQAIKPLYDSIIILNSINRAIVLESQNKVKALEDDKRDLIKKVENLENKITKLNENKIKVEHDSLKLKVDSLSARVEDLKKILSQKELQIINERQSALRKSIEEKEKGKQEALNQIFEAYDKPFDELIKMSTIKTVERDLEIVKKNNNELREKYVHLQKYFTSKAVLAEKYNERNVNLAKREISSLPQTDLVKNLTKRLNEYKLSNEGLIETIDKILSIDKKFIANDDNDQKRKLNLIFAELSSYFRNYRFNFSEDPYLSDIILEIMKQKQRDANTDISSFLDKL